MQSEFMSEVLAEMGCPHVFVNIGVLIPVHEGKGRPAAYLAYVRVGVYLGVCSKILLSGILAISPLSNLSRFRGSKDVIGYNKFIFKAIHAPCISTCKRTYPKRNINYT